MSPVGGLTRNLWGDEVCILKAIGLVGFSDLSCIVVRHLLLSVNSMRTSAGSYTSTSFSISIYQVRVIRKYGNMDSEVFFFVLGMG